MPDLTLKFLINKTKVKLGPNIIQNVCSFLQEKEVKVSPLLRSGRSFSQELMKCTLWNVMSTVSTNTFTCYNSTLSEQFGDHADIILEVSLALMNIFLRITSLIGFSLCGKDFWIYKKYIQIISNITNNCVANLQLNYILIFCYICVIVF